jgi:aryl-alcohol dehydrogenase-like predicted oxidoreductase
MSATAFLLRYTLTHPDVHTTIVGTLNPAHLQENLAAVRQGPLPADVYQEARRRLREAAAGATQGGEEASRRTPDCCC